MASAHNMDQRLLPRLATVCGVACAVIGAAHAVGGVHTVPGATDANATVDSQERFYGPIFAVYGLAWVRAARGPVDLRTIDMLSAAMAAGGAARVLSMAQHGRPHPMYVALTGVEFAVPAVFGWLTRAARKDA